MALFDRASVRLQPFFGYRSQSRLTITARALRAGPPRDDVFARRGRLQAMRTMLAQFASREVPGLAVRLELRRIDGTTIEHHGVTDGEGYVRFDIALDPVWPLPSDPAWEIACLHWITPDGAQCVEGFVLAPGSATKLAVVSDIDDTIVETGITGGPREALAKKLRNLEPHGFETIAGEGAEFGLVMIRRMADGSVAMIGEIEDDAALVERAARKLLAGS
jgi:phosphatidate phosphatase APP1